MKIGNFYFDEKDFLFVFSLIILLVLKYFKIQLISFLSLEKLFIILFLSFLARILLGTGKETIIFIIILFGMLISNTLSYPGLIIFLLLSFFMMSIFFRNY
jgi:hypothetical protein